MNLKVTAYQRFCITMILRNIEGRNVGIIRKASDLIDLFDLSNLSEVERATIGYTLQADGEANWTNTTYRFEIEIKDGNLSTFLKQQVRAFVWPSGSLANDSVRASVLELYELLGIESED